MEKNRKLENMVLLATSHNVAKAYISKLNSAGFEPNKVILLDIKQRRVSYLAKFKFVFKKYPLKEIYKKIFNKLTLRLRKNRNGLLSTDFETILSKIKAKLTQLGVFTTDLNQSTISILQDVGWKFDKIEATSINDQNLINYLDENVTEKYIIYSGGGILRDSILNIGKRFIHVHPGLVPEVKGADCILWSALVYNKIGMSSFIMNKGIDTGDIIYTKEYEIPLLDIEGQSHDLKTMKHSLINYVDPHFRAEHLVATFKKEMNPEKWDTHRQNSTVGKQYYFMHDTILPAAISKFVDSKNNKAKN